MAFVRFTRTGLEASGEGAGQRLLAFIDTVLRGAGQVMFQENSYTGLLFIIGIAWNSLLFAGAAVLGTVVSTITARVLGADRALIRAGMFGFNGALVGIALLYFLEPNALAWACVVLAAACSTIMMAALMALLDAWKMPALTAPFVFTSLCFFLATARFGRLQSTDLLPTAGLPGAVMVEGVVTPATVADGLFNGIAQVFFQGSVVTGVVFAAGLLVASRIACVAALAGSLAGLLVAWGMGAAEPAIRAGAYGFNSVLTAIALAGVFLAPTRMGVAYALLGAIATPFVVAAAAAALEPLGMPALTLPFVLVTWLFLFASRVFPTLRPAGAPGVAPGQDPMP